MCELWQRSSPSPRTLPLSPQFFHWPVRSTLQEVWPRAAVGPEELQPLTCFARQLFFCSSAACLHFSCKQKHACLVVFVRTYTLTLTFPFIFHLLPKPTHPCNNCQHQISNPGFRPTSIRKISSFQIDVLKKHKNIFLSSQCINTRTHIKHTHTCQSPHLWSHMAQCVWAWGALSLRRLPERSKSSAVNLRCCR